MGYVSSHEGISESWAHKKKRTSTEWEPHWSDGTSEFHNFHQFPRVPHFCHLRFQLKFSVFSSPSKLSLSLRNKEFQKMEKLWQKTNENSIGSIVILKCSLKFQLKKTFSAFNSSCRRISCSALRMITFLNRFETCHVVVVISYTTDVSITLSIWDV